MFNWIPFGGFVNTEFLSSSFLCTGKITVSLISSITWLSPAMLFHETVISYGFTKWLAIINSWSVNYNKTDSLSLFGILQLIINIAYVLDFFQSKTSQLVECLENTH